MEQSAPDPWMEKLEAATSLGVSEWARTLAAVPRRLYWNPRYTAQIVKFLDAHKSAGVIEAMRAGISGQQLSLAIQTRPPDQIPSLIEAFLSDQRLVSSTDLRQIAFAATKNDQVPTNALEVIAEFLFAKPAGDLAIVRDVSSVVGANNLEMLRHLAEISPSEEVKDSVIEAGVLSASKNLEADDSLTSLIDTNIVGKDAQSSAFHLVGESLAAKSANVESAKEVILWLGGLDGFQQSAALRGWTVSLQEELGGSIPLQYVLDSGAISPSDTQFVTRILRESLPLLRKEGGKGRAGLSKLLDQHPEFRAIFLGEPAIKELLSVPSLP